MESEDAAAREARVEKLWRRLDTKNEGKLDANGLKRGLQGIDHRKRLNVVEEFCYSSLDSFAERR